MFNHWVDVSDGLPRVVSTGSSRIDERQGVCRYRREKSDCLSLLLVGLNILNA